MNENSRYDDMPEVVKGSVLNGTNLMQADGVNS